MIYSSACGHAIRALAHLAAMETDGFVLMEDLCGPHDLPRPFVAKIFQDLVRRGLLRSAKGRGGGFALARPASEILIYDIVTAIDGDSQFQECVVGLSGCDQERHCPLHEEWGPIRNTIEAYLRDTTLEQMSVTLRRKMALAKARPGDGSRSATTGGRVRAATGRKKAAARSTRTRKAKRGARRA